MTLTAAEFQRLHGSGVGNQVIGKKPAIRLPKAKKMSKPEREYERILQTEFPPPFYVIKYEEFSFKLDGGGYCPDFTVWKGNAMELVVEVKGSYRLQSAGRSHFAFKAAKAAWPDVQFRFAQDTGHGWIITE